MNSKKRKRAGRARELVWKQVGPLGLACASFFGGCAQLRSAWPGSRQSLEWNNVDG